MQRFQLNDRVQLNTAKSFNNPTQTLNAGSKGTIIQLFADNLRYRVKFDSRIKQSIIMDPDLSKG